MADLAVTDVPTWTFTAQARDQWWWCFVRDGHVANDPQELGGLAEAMSARSRSVLEPQSEAFAISLEGAWDHACQAEWVHAHMTADGTVVEGPAAPGTRPVTLAAYHSVF